MARHAWEEARALFREAEQGATLSPADLELLGEAGWWSGHPDERVDALERITILWQPADASGVHP